MIEIPRNLARQFRAVLRKSVLLDSPRGTITGIMLLCDADGLTVRARQADIAVQYRIKGNFGKNQLVLPSSAFDDFEGADSIPVRLERSQKGVTARWIEKGVPRLQQYEWNARDKPVEWPATPQAMVAMPAEFRRIFDDAVQVAARGTPSRYALHRVQFRGSAGQLIATDGKQLLIQSRLTFPFKEDLVVPRIAVFGIKGFAQEAPIQLGRSAKFLTIQVGPWCFHLAIDNAARFPRTEEVIPKAKPVAVWHVSPSEAENLLKVLPKLPGDKDDNAPVTVDLDGKAVIRAKADGPSRITELVLEGSKVSGKALRFATCRTYLARALQLGFTEFAIVSPDVPVVCRDDRRQYIWMPLGERMALRPAPNALRITPSLNGKGPSTVISPSRKSAMSTNGSHKPAPRPSAAALPAHATAPVSLIDETLAVQALLREAQARTQRILAGLRLHKKQHRLLATLRQLPQVQP